MSVVIDLADYRDVTPREDEIRLPEDAFVLKALQLADDRAGPEELVEAHTWLSVAALRGSAKARIERIKLSRRLSSSQIAEAQAAVVAFAAGRLASA